MTSQNPTPNDESSKASQDNSWREVGRQFQELGESLAAALRTAWEDEENRKRLNEMRTGLESMVNNVNQAVKDTADSPYAQQAKEEASKAVNSVSNAVEQTAQEIRPHLVSALRQMNTDLQKFIDRIKDS